MFFMDYRLFQTLNKDSSRQASFPSCPCFSYSSPNSLLPLVSHRVRADLPGTRLKASLVHCKFWRLSLWCLHGGLTRGSEQEQHMMELGYSFTSSRHLSAPGQTQPTSTPFLDEQEFMEYWHTQMRQKLEEPQQMQLLVTM